MEPAAPVSMSRRTLVPGRPLGFVVVGTLVLGQVWSMTQSSWLWLAVVLVPLVAAVDWLWALWVLRRPRVAVVATPDATVGRPQLVRVVVASPRGLVRVRMRSIPGAPWVALEAPCEGDVEVVPDARGVFGLAMLDLDVDAPLGIVRIRRTVVVALGGLVHVAPRPIVPLRIPEPVGASDGDRRTAARALDVPRSVRDYVPGDPRRLVHWPATARTGHLVVKELESAALPEMFVVVDLGAVDGEPAEAAASRGFGLVQRVLDGGGRVTLLTREREGLVTAPVTSMRAAGRRLAGAIVGPPVPLPDDGRTVVRVKADGAP